MIKFFSKSALERSEARQLLGAGVLSTEETEQINRVLLCYDSGIHEIHHGLKVNATTNRLLGGALLFIVGEMLLGYAVEKLGSACCEAAKAGWKSLTGSDAATSAQENHQQLIKLQSKFEQLSQEQQQKINAQLETIKGLIPARLAHLDPELEADNALQLSLAVKKIKAMDLPRLTQHIVAEMRDMNSKSIIIYQREFKGQMNSNVQAVTNGDFNFGS